MDPCSICQEDGILHSTPCNHAFHQECLDRWFEQQRIAHRSPNCPICRRDIAIENPLIQDDHLIGRSAVDYYNALDNSNVAIGHNALLIHNTRNLTGFAPLVTNSLADNNALVYNALSANVPGYYNHPGSNQLESWNGVI